MALVSHGFASCAAPFVLPAGAAAGSAQVELGSLCYSPVIGRGAT